MKTILVPTDFSKCAYVATQFAVELAHITKAKIVLLNTFQIPMPPPESFVTPISFADLQDGSKKQLKTMAEIELRINKKYTDLQIEYEAAMGGTVSEIVDAAKKHDAEMIVMGTHGASGIMKNIFGSNTAGVIAKAHCPTFAIPSNAKFTGLKKLAFAIDLHQIKNDSVEQLLEFAQEFNSEINVVSVVTDPSQTISMEQEIERINGSNVFKQIPHSIHISVNEDVQKAIDVFIDETHSDALIVMPKKHNFLEYLFNQSVTRKLAYDIKIPIFCIPFHSNKDHVMAMVNNDDNQLTK